jgi:hypothetical protein
MDRESQSSSRHQLIDLITVVFEPELYLLELQARSISLYIDHLRIKNIYIVVNDDSSICDLIDPLWWGINHNKVNIIHRSAFGVDPTLDGWSSQQLYKLCAANIAESEWSMCLDAKTWFVQTLDWARLFDDGGRIKFTSLPTIPVFRPAQLSIEKYFEIELPRVIGPGGVPFMFHTETVKDMINYIPDFFEFFCTNVKLPSYMTEFMLYSGFVIKKYNTYDTLYSTTQHYQVTNLADWQINKFDSMLNRMGHDNNLTISIQGRAYPHLSESQMDKWCEFLLTKHIILHKEIAKLKLNTLR